MISVGRVEPGGRGYGDKIMREVDKDVQQVPRCEAVGVRSGSALGKPVAGIAPLHVMACQQLGSPRLRSLCSIRLKSAVLIS